MITRAAAFGMLVLAAGCQTAKPPEVARDPAGPVAVADTQIRVDGQQPVAAEDKAEDPVLRSMTLQQAKAHFRAGVFRRLENQLRFRED